MASAQVTVRVIAPQAWRCECGRLNDGPHTPRAFCVGCRTVSDRPEARYVLAELDPEE
ncbi:MAG TPA: hypothetical protein VIS06_17535 [Mycobacteriales bacterium]|jgi:hypothetical protein